MTNFKLITAYCLLSVIFISGCSTQRCLIRNSHKPDAKFYINPCVKLENYEIAYIQKPEKNTKNLTADDRIIQNYIKGEIGIAFEKAGFFKSVTYDKKMLNKPNALKVASSFTVDYGNRLWRSHLGFLGFGKTKILLEIKLKDAKTNTIVSKHKGSLTGTGWESVDGGDPNFLIKKDVREIVRSYIDLLKSAWRKNSSAELRFKLLHKAPAYRS
ncbi:hypothetical protein KAI19_02055 [bacterium]|nr:hypothetical protein [bacterium]